MRSAEYKQVTVLFADVVHSMQLAAAVGAERLREIMAELASQCAAVVHQFGGTVDKFTGDGIMAVFGAPAALEDHAIRACMAALGIQEQANVLAIEVRRRDGVELRLRVGLNSGQVIAGEIGSGAFGYTTIGEQVGIAQRMESAAPPGGVMLSASTARLVDGAVRLGAPELVAIKGAAEPVPASRLLGPGMPHRAVLRTDSHLVGRRWEIAAVEGLLERAAGGHGAVVGVVGPSGIGKSRIWREVAAIAARRGAEIFAAFCESYAKKIPFFAVTRLLRAVTGVDDLDPQAARDRVRAQLPGADSEDLLLFDDLLGIADHTVDLPAIDSDARRRRLTALVNATSLARETPALYVIEDAHWIDEVSESMLADFFAVIPQTRSVVLVTYRPDYAGALARVPGAQTISLAPLSDDETEALVSELVGLDPSVQGLAHTIAARAAGNPFFAEEITRELAERGVLHGQRSAYVAAAEGAEVTVPATLQATIAARIDRLAPDAKRTLSAASVLGRRFGLDLLVALRIEPVVADLVAGEFIDQVKFTGAPEYVFRHPLIRAVAYEAQLKSDRAELHRRAAAAIEHGEPGSADDNAALIAEHLHAAGDLHGAFGWHMRAGMWLTHRNLPAARASWQRARQVADRLPDNDPERAALRISSRTMLCVSAWLVGGTMADTGFEELRELADATGDTVSLATGMAGRISTLTVHACFDEASRLASELIDLLESIDDPTLTLGLLYAAVVAKFQVGEFSEAQRLAQRMIDLAGGDIRKGDLVIGSPLIGAITLRGCARCCLGDQRWRADIDNAVAMLGELGPIMRGMVLLFVCSTTIGCGVSLPDAAILRQTAELIEIAERSGDDFSLACARYVRGLTLVHCDGPQRDEGVAVLTAAREATLKLRFTVVVAAFVDIYLAREKARAGDIDGAIELSRTALEEDFVTGDRLFIGPATAILVEALLSRRSLTDLREAAAAVDRLAAVPTEPGFAIHEIWVLRLRALLAQARGDDVNYHNCRDRYRALATSLAYQGHIKWAYEMA
ncbi:ATP-binding protein [Mycobacterium simiae]|uniref:ATP-binding protein n=1 Tax=Mycobacterium simiae TaxID=1784 RepID=UPI0027BAD965|nr:adenylate/guanylate cyclase domain-containing protein [Mycobacterium simiae]